MIKIFVDTSTWRYWFDKKAGKPFSSKLEEEINAFNEIFNDIICPRSQKFVLLYNNRVESELGKLYRLDFEEITYRTKMKRIPIPRSLADSLYKADGSLLAGGKCGGSLHDKLNDCGHDHETALQSSLPDFSQPNPNLTNAYFKIEEYSLDKLTSEGIPDKLIENLQQLKDRKPVKIKKFLQVLNEAIGEDQVNQYKSLILKYGFMYTEERRKEFDIEHLESALEAEAHFVITMDKGMRHKLKNALYPTEALPRLRNEV